MLWLNSFVDDYIFENARELWSISPNAMECLKLYIAKFPDDVNIGLLQKLIKTYHSEEDIEGQLVATCRVLYEIVPKLEKFSNKEKYTSNLLEYIRYNEG